MNTENTSIRKAITNDINSVMEVIKSCTIDMISKNIFQWNDKYPNIEIRLFGIFRGDIKNKMQDSKRFLDDFPNIKIVFQTDSIERIESNYDYFKS